MSDQPVILAVMVFVQQIKQMKNAIVKEWHAVADR
jgi:hypothetical protein